MRKSMYSPIQTQSSFAHHCLILAPSVVTCPGGLGTFEELSEFLCQRQLGLHQKPIALLNTRGFFDPLLKQFAHMIAEGFLPAAHIQSLIVEDDVTTLLDKVPPPPGLSCIIAKLNRGQSRPDIQIQKISKCAVYKFIQMCSCFSRAA